MLISERLRSRDAGNNALRGMASKLVVLTINQHATED